MAKVVIRIGCATWNSNLKSYLICKYCVIRLQPDFQQGRRSLKMYIAKKFIWQNPQGFAFTSQWGSVILLIGNVPIKVEGKKVLMQWAILNYAHFKKGPFPWPSLLRWFWWTRHDRAKCISWFFCDKVDGSSGAAHIAPHGKQSIKKQKLFTISMESKKIIGNENWVVKAHK